MNPRTLSLLTALTLTTPLVAAARPAQSGVTGAQLIATLAAARGVKLAPADLVAFRSPTAAGASRLASLAGKLRIGAGVMSQLTKNAVTPVPALLATQAVMESISGKTLNTDLVRLLVARNPGMLVTSLASLRELVADANTLANMNAALVNAGKPVTPLGGGR
jgi:hypothetical protein